MDDGSTLLPSQVMYRDTLKETAYAAAKLTFGRNVKRARKLQNMSQEDLGLKIHADQAYISRVESGVLNPTIESITEIAQALGVQICDLFKS